MIKQWAAKQDSQVNDDNNNNNNNRTNTHTRTMMNGMRSMLIRRNTVNAIDGVRMLPPPTYEHSTAAKLSRRIQQQQHIHTHARA